MALLHVYIRLAIFTTKPLAIVNKILLTSTGLNSYMEDFLTFIVGKTCMHKGNSLDLITRSHLIVVVEMGC